MKKVVINQKFGGFGLSKEALLYLRALGNKFAIESPSLKGEKYEDGSAVDFEFGSFLRDIDRTDPDLIQTVETLGEKADGRFARLMVISIPDDVEYTIEEYDGWEHIAENHRTWGKYE